MGRAQRQPPLQVVASFLQLSPDDGDAAEGAIRPDSPKRIRVSLRYAEELRAQFAGRMQLALHPEVAAQAEHRMKDLRRFTDLPADVVRPSITARRAFGAISFGH